MRSRSKSIYLKNGKTKGDFFIIIQKGLEIHFNLFLRINGEDTLIMNAIKKENNKIDANEFYESITCITDIANILEVETKQPPTPQSNKMILV